MNDLNKSNATVKKVAKVAKVKKVRKPKQVLKLAEGITGKQMRAKTKVGRDASKAETFSLSKALKRYQKFVMPIHKESIVGFNESDVTIKNVDASLPEYLRKTDKWSEFKVEKAMENFYKVTE
jgi:hypothetical protein